MKRHIVVTGVGLVTPLGNTVQSTWSGLLAGRDTLSPDLIVSAVVSPAQLSDALGAENQWVKVNHGTDDKDRKECHRDLRPKTQENHLLDGPQKPKHRDQKQQSFSQPGG
ncbi:MAG: hypothetical protein H0W76_02875 [Pyrinomonadaceae bacterium]|nr:hypothetical protein [Pyrinomonadaceae bacterium]